MTLRHHAIRTSNEGCIAIVMCGAGRGGGGGGGEAAERESFVINLNRGRNSGCLLCAKNEVGKSVQ